MNSDKMIPEEKNPFIKQKSKFYLTPNKSVGSVFLCGVAAIVGAIGGSTYEIIKQMRASNEKSLLKHEQTDLKIQEINKDIENTKKEFGEIKKQLKELLEKEPYKLDVSGDCARLKNETQQQNRVLTQRVDELQRQLDNNARI